MNELMNPLLNIIKFIYEQKGSELNINSINNFDEGVYFPEFISLIFNEKINNLKKIKGIEEILFNFNATLAFIRRNGIRVRNFGRLPYSDEKETILLTVITRAYFKMDAGDIFKQSKLILESKGLKGNYDNVHKIYNSRFLLTLLNVLSSDRVKIPDESKKTNFDDVVESLKKTGITIAIDSDSFEEDKKQIYFLIQIQIIFAIYSNKIKGIEADKKRKKLTRRAVKKNTQRVKKFYHRTLATKGS